MDELYITFFYFFIYSVAGWILETIYCRIVGGKWVNRGFLYGPYCPIYGAGAIIIMKLLEHVNTMSTSPIKVFLYSFFFTSLLEYITSFVMEKMFDAKWWDYSNYKFNINGRVCLLNSTLFGICGLLLVYVVKPFVSTRVNSIPIELIALISKSLAVIMLVDTISTVITLLNLKERLSIIANFAETAKNKLLSQKPNININIADDFEEFRKKLFSKKDLQVERILNAFPNFEFVHFKKQFADYKNDLIKFKESLKIQKKDKKDKKEEKEKEKEKAEAK